jgi:hypothetical protein
MLNGGRGVGWGLLAVVALVVGALSWMGWRLYLNTGSMLPPASWVSAVLLVVMAALVLAAGLPVRRFLRGRASRTLSPIRAARTLVLAQAAALTGAAVLGWYAAQALLVVPDADIASQGALLWRLLALCAGAALLAGAGMAAQAMCRIPPRDDTDESEGAAEGA